MKLVAIIVSLRLVTVQCQPLADETRLQECGRTNSRGPKIFGGDTTKSGEQPWQVAIFSFEDSEAKGFCGGSLISEKFVLTAAHCLTTCETCSLRVRLGDHNLADDSEELPCEEHAVRRKIIHENFTIVGGSGRDKVGFNDIALLELDEPLKYKEHIGPICLPERNEDFVGVTAFHFGWGKTNNGQLSPPLQSIDVQIYKNNVCDAWFTSDSLPFRFQETWLCAGFRKNKRGPCSGDSGGPLVLYRDGRAQVIGVLGYIVECGLPDAPEIYLKVSHYMEWINANIGASSAAKI